MKSGETRNETPGITLGTYVGQLDATRCDEL